MPKKDPNKRGSTASFRCSLCEQRVRIPKGWSRGAGVRRHYWRKHPDVMRGESGRA